MKMPIDYKTLKKINEIFVKFRLPNTPMMSLLGEQIETIKDKYMGELLQAEEEKDVEAIEEWRRKIIRDLEEGKL